MAVTVFLDNFTALLNIVCPSDWSKMPHGAAPSTGQGLHHQSLQALTAHIAVIDDRGCITFVNDAWLTFARNNGGDARPVLVIGTNYLDACRKAVSHVTDAAPALAGIEAVLAGTLAQFSMEYPCHSPREPQWFLMTVAPLDRNRPAGAVISHVNITVARQAEQALHASEQHFRAIFENAAVGIAEVTPDGRWLRVNQRLRQITGRSAEALAATSYLDITHPDDVDADVTQLEVMRAGATDGYRVEKRCLRTDGSSVWVNVTVSCVRAGDGGIDYLIAVFEDISERKQAEARQRTLLHESAHRGRNQLAVIRSIANRSLSGPATLEEARLAFNGRLEALAQTYDALTDEAFEGVLLEAVLQNALAGFDARIRLQGPAVVLTVQASQTFALVAHELATNAAKYGALSVLDGRLEAGWSVAGPADDPLLRFEWQETGGPPASRPTRRGFGTTLVSVIAGSEFDCTPELIYGPAGFRYRFMAPLSRLGAVRYDSHLRRRLRSPVARSLYDTWARHRGMAADLPELGGVDWTRFAATGALTIAVVEQDASIRFAHVGRALIEELGRPLRDQELAEDDGTGMAEVYQHCALTGEPTHEVLRFNFGDGDPLTFERLLVPFSASAGRSVTHVVGVAIYDGHTRPVHQLA